MKWVDFSSVFSAMLKVDWLETLSLADMQKKVIAATQWKNWFITFFSEM